MLQQILRDMYVDPEILAELDDQQKQTLFCKMREEQVRRWKTWNEQFADHEPEPDRFKTSDKKKQVNFLNGSDGEPWVWVMGEHENDKTIEEIVKEETIEKARKMAEKETEELRKQVEAQLSEYIDLTPKIEDLQDLQPSAKLQIEDDMDIYCSVDELREKINNNSNKVFQPKLSNFALNHYPTTKLFGEARDVLHEITFNTQKVAHKVALWEKKMTEERTCEIFRKIQKKQRETAIEAEEEDKKKDQLWREQERKAKQAEQQIREIARRAREEHRLNSTINVEPVYSAITAGVPPGRQAVVDWYKKSEKSRKAGVDADGNTEKWFHGLITRHESEKLLLDQPYGSFLVRLSERIWGYAISYRAAEKCKHYLVNACPKYCFLGGNQVEHDTLGDLVIYHYSQPLTGGEKLIRPCPRLSSTAIEELFN